MFSILYYNQPNVVAIFKISLLILDLESQPMVNKLKNLILKMKLKLNQTTRTKSQPMKI